MRRRAGGSSGQPTRATQRLRGVVLGRRCLAEALLGARLGVGSAHRDGLRPEGEMVAAGAMFRRTALSYSAGHVFNDLSAACWYTYLLVFLTKVCLPSLSLLFFLHAQGVQL